MSKEEQYGYLSATTDINKIIMSHMTPGDTDDKTFDLLSQIIKEIGTNYDSKIAK